MLTTTVLDLSSTLIVAIPPTLLALATLLTALRTNEKTDKVQKQINGRMDELLQTAKALAHSKGKMEGLKEGGALPPDITIPSENHLEVVKEFKK